MRTLNLLAACLLTTAVVALCSCAAPSAEDASPPPPPPPAAQAAPLPTRTAPDRQVETVLDPSASVERHQFDASLQGLGAAIRTLPHALPPRGESAPQPGVRVGVRAINGTAYGPDALLASGTIESIPAVDPLPSGGGGDITQAAIAIREQRSAAAAAYARARAQAATLAHRISRLSPPVAGCSDVWGAVSAAAESFTAPDRRLVLVTDLAVHCRSNVAGSLDGVRVLVVHICVEARTCAAQQRYWQRALRARGALGVEFARFELMRERLRAYVQEAQP